MRPVSIVATGMTPFGVHSELTIRDLARQAGQECLAGAGAGPGQIEALYLGNFAGPSFVGQNHLAPYVGSALGLQGVPCTRFEAACASSGSAFFHAYGAVAGGLYDLVLVIGVELMTSQSTARTTDILASAGDLRGEVKAGATFPSLFAMIARRHMYEFGTTREHLAAVAVKNHANGAKNPLAHLRKEITLEKALSARMISDPLGLYDCSLISDGAAAVLLCASESAGRFTDKPVTVRGIAQASDHVALDEKQDITTFPAVKAASEKAYRMAGVGADDIDFAELHDCFTIAEIVALEDLGFVPRGQGGPATAEGFTSPHGEKPVNTSGGLKSKGHPVGATGVAQIREVVEQIRGNCGERQLKKANIGLTENLGGSGATCVVGIFSA
ncbi:MAG: thiolase domain-containing protein [Acidobacteria bacterium]|nr:thiolase domain-containing protein [Acidobacteriota bacterium]